MFLQYSYLSVDITLLSNANGHALEDAATSLDKVDYFVVKQCNDQDPIASNYEVNVGRLLPPNFLMISYYQIVFIFLLYYIFSILYHNLYVIYFVPTCSILITIDISTQHFYLTSILRQNLSACLVRLFLLSK